MSKIKNDGLDQYGAGPFEQQQFGTAGVERVNASHLSCIVVLVEWNRKVAWQVADTLVDSVSAHGTCS